MLYNRIIGLSAVNFFSDIQPSCLKPRLPYRIQQSFRLKSHKTYCHTVRNKILPLKQIDTMIVDSYVLNIARYLHRDFPVTRFSFRQLFSPFSHLQRYCTDICIITRTTIFFKHKAYYCKKICRFTIHLLQSMRIYKDDTIIKSIPEIFFSKSVTNV